MTEWVLNRVEWEALKFTPRSLFTVVRGREILRSSVTQSGRGCYASALHKAATEYLRVKTR
jgi:hypothetical protein